MVVKKISVIVPVYKVESYIGNTIKSLLSQTYKDFELIVVDDGSPDQSANIAESLLRESSIEYHVIHTVNRGVSAARNTGLDNAEGLYIIMVDADDVLTPDFLDKYVSLMQKYPGRNIYSTSFTIFKGEEVMEQPKINEPIVEYGAEDAQIAFYNRNPRFLLPTLMYSKEFLDKYAELLKKMHESGKLSRADYHPFDRFIAYENEAKEFGHDFEEEYPMLRKEIFDNKEFLESQKLVLCHNDAQEQYR